MVAGQVVEVLVISIQYKVIPLSTAIIHQRNHPLHILAEHDGAQHSVLILAWEPALTEFCLEHGFEPHFRFVLPLHRKGAGIVDGEDGAVR